MLARAPHRPARCLALLAGTCLVACTTPAPDPGIATATEIVTEVGRHLAAVSDTAFRPYVDHLGPGLVLHFEDGCRPVGRLAVPVGSDAGVALDPEDEDRSFLGDLAITPSACDSLLRQRRESVDTLLTIQLVSDAYGARDTVAATAILAIHEWFHHAYIDAGHRIPARLLSRAARAFTGEAATTESAATAQLRTTARSALADALAAASPGDRAAALRRYRCARRTLFADQPMLDSLAQVREAEEGPAIVTSLRVGRALGLLDRDPREVIRAALVARLWAPQDTAAAEPGREFHYVTAAALTLLAEATVPGAADSLRYGGLLERLVVPGEGGCPTP